MARAPQLPWPERLSIEERLTIASERADRIIDLVRAVDQIHQTNQLVLYTDILSAQIPRSYAGHAFRQFQQSFYQFELIRLASMWDPPSKDRSSIPTVRLLIDNDEVMSAAAEKTRAHYARPYPIHIDAEGAGPEVRQDIERQLRVEQQQRAGERADICMAELRQAIQRCDEVVASQELRSLRTLRDQAIAHNLDLPRQDEAAYPERWRYGGEADLLRVTIVVANLLHSALNRSSFDWDEMRGYHIRNAKELWENCAFDIPGR